MKSQLDSIWQRIEKEKIKPLPKWVLLIRQVGIWSGFAASVAFGALTLAYLVFLLENMNADILLVTMPWEMISLAPLTWTVTFILFLVLAFWTVEHTESGYKIHFSLWILGNIALTSVLALFLIAMEIPRNLEPSINSFLPPISATRFEERLWHRGNEGRLQGEVLSSKEDQIVLQNIQGEQWIVLIRPHTKRPTSLEKSITIRVIGRITGEQEVEADMIIPVPRPFKRPPEKRPLEIRGFIQ